MKVSKFTEVRIVDFKIRNNPVAKMFQERSSFLIVLLHYCQPSNGPD